MTTITPASAQSHQPYLIQLRCTDALLPEESNRRRMALQAYTFPPALVARLRREQQWSAAYTGVVLEEYRRFLLLAATSGVSVTPSRTVDHPWHAHLEFTRDYWDHLCAQAITEPLHHTPGEPEDDAQYRQAYLDTLDLYAATFGGRAPVAVWPDPRRATFTKAPKEVLVQRQSVRTG